MTGLKTITINIKFIWLKLTLKIITLTSFTFKILEIYHCVCCYYRDKIQKIILTYAASNLYNKSHILHIQPDVL